MIHDPALLEKLSTFRVFPFDDEVHRATRINQDALAPSTRGGRWAPEGEVSVLYTSLAREGALAELAFHWSQLTPLPSKPAALHQLRVSTGKTLRLLEGELTTLGVDPEVFREIGYQRTQEIGAAVAFLGYAGLIVPSARWNCENLIVMMDNHAAESTLLVVATEEVDWRAWARVNGLLDRPGQNE